VIVEGQTIYFGKTTDALPYFAKIGLDCEKSWNPADFISMYSKWQRKTLLLLLLWLLS
jgi:hypothetical protein